MGWIERIEAEYGYEKTEDGHECTDDRTHRDGWTGLFSFDEMEQKSVV